MSRINKYPETKNKRFRNRLLFNIVPCGTNFKRPLPMDQIHPNSMAIEKIIINGEIINIIIMFSVNRLKDIEIR